MTNTIELPKTDSLTRDQVCEFLAEYRLTGNVEWRNKVVEANMKLVLSIAHKYEVSLGAEEAASEGFIALIQAAERFDAALGVEFSTYAVKVIKTHLNRVHEETNIRSSARQWRIREFKRVENLLYNKTGRTPDIDEIADGLINHIGRSKPMKSQKWSLEKAIEIRKAIQTGNYMSINATKENETTLDWIGSTYDEDAVEIEDVNRQVMEALNSLPDREREVIQGRFFEKLTLEELGSKMNLTRERVRQIEAMALTKLKKQLGVKMPELPPEPAEEPAVEISAPRKRMPKAPEGGWMARNCPDSLRSKVIAGYTKNGGTMNFSQLEAYFDLRPTNGMTAYRIVKGKTK